MVSRAFQNHCSSSRLKSYLNDGLSDFESAALADHLDHCANCQRTLERLAAGTRLWSELRRLAPAASTDLLEPPAMAKTPRQTSPTDDDIPLDFLAPPANEDSLGRLGSYEVTDVLGRGAFGIVLRA